MPADAEQPTRTAMNRTESPVQLGCDSEGFLLLVLEEASPGQPFHDAFADQVTQGAAAALGDPPQEGGVLFGKANLMFGG